MFKDQTSSSSLEGIDDALEAIGLMLALLNLIATICLAINAWDMMRLLARRRQSDLFFQELAHASILMTGTDFSNRLNSNENSNQQLDAPLLLEDIQNFLNVDLNATASRNEDQIQLDLDENGNGNDFDFDLSSPQEQQIEVDDVFENNNTNEQGVTEL
jgi:hypothetical protein